MQINIPITLNVKRKSSIEIITEMARVVHKKNPDVPFKTIRNLYIRGRHGALTHYKIPNRLNGQKLGLRKREILAKQYEVK